MYANTASIDSPWSNIALITLQKFKPMFFSPEQQQQQKKSGS